MEGHAVQCVERYCELAHKTPASLKLTETPCIDDHQLKPEDFEIEGELASIRARIALKCLYLARIGRPDLLWTVNILARAVTKWNKSCDKKARETYPLHMAHSYLHPDLLCPEQRRRMQFGFVPGRVFCRRSRRFKIYLRRVVVRLWRPYLCSYHLDAQKANRCLSQQCRSRSNIP